MPRFAGGMSRDVDAVDEALPRRDRSRPAIMRSSVDFPQPEGPSSAVKRALLDSEIRSVIAVTDAVALGHAPQFDMRRRSAPFLAASTVIP